MSKDLILDILKDGPLTPHEIVAALTEQEGEALLDISTQIFELVKDGRVDYAGRSKFRLADAS